MLINATDLRDRLGNCNESDIFTSVISRHVLAEISRKWVHKTTSGSCLEVTTTPEGQLHSDAYHHISCTKEAICTQPRSDQRRSRRSYVFCVR